MSDLYTGIGLALPLILFAIIVLLGFLVGKYAIGIKTEEALVNSFCCIVFPIYLDIFSVVSINLKCCHEINTPNNFSVVMPNREIHILGKSKDQEQNKC